MKLEDIMTLHTQLKVLLWAQVEHAVSGSADGRVASALRDSINRRELEAVIGGLERAIGILTLLNRNAAKGAP